MKWASTEDGPRLPIIALFYVNDTLTASLEESSAGSLLAKALQSAESAYRNALVAQRALVVPFKERVLPVLQYRVTSECFDARPVEQRFLLRARDSAPSKLSPLSAPG